MFRGITDTSKVSQIALGQTRRLGRTACCKIDTFNAGEAGVGQTRPEDACCRKILPKTAQAAIEQTRPKAAQAKGQTCPKVARAAIEQTRPKAA
jgi:hypothetical protein